MTPVCRTQALSLFAATIILGATLCVAQPPDVHKVADAVDKHYNSLGSLETPFEESYRGGGMARVESGTMWLKKPGKMRWEYTSPTQKLFVTDGKQVWFYVPGEKQARRMALRDLDDLRSPLRYLLGHTKLEKEFIGLSLAPDQKPATAGNTMLRGIPKSMQDRMSYVLIEITPQFNIARIYIEELDGSATEFRFTQQKENVVLNDKRFRFTPPAGVEVMEAKELQP